VTLALAAGLAGPTAASATAASIVHVPGYEGLRVCEATSVRDPVAGFDAGDARLTSVLAGGGLSQSGRNFGSFAGHQNDDLV
jgi:hypothetical protein